MGAIFLANAQGPAGLVLSPLYAIANLGQEADVTIPI